MAEHDQVADFTEFTRAMAGKFKPGPKASRTRGRQR